MEFRWIALLAVYTLLIGPVIGVPSGDGATKPTPAPVQAKAKTQTSKTR